MKKYDMLCNAAFRSSVQTPYYYTLLTNFYSRTRNREVRESLVVGNISRREPVLVNIKEVWSISSGLSR